MACHTHELLACSCQSSPSGPPEANIDGETSRPRRKFIQPDSQEEEPNMGFISGTQVDVDKLSNAVREDLPGHQLLTILKEMRKKRDALSSLADWAHINCMKSTARDLIQDNVLRGLVYSPRGVDSSPPIDEDEHLWNDIDDDTPPVQPDLDVKDVPGGTITYVFERFSTNL